DDYFNLLRTSDVLISNTYSDGFGMVMSEAMANGLIVIGTYNSAAPDIIEHEKNGFVIESRNPLQLYEIMHWLLKHKDKLDAIKLSAITKAESCTWKHYRRKLIEIVQD